MKTRLCLLLVAATTAIGCARDGTTPTPTAATPPVLVPTNQPAWSVDVTFVDVDGATNNCMARDRQTEIGGGWKDAQVWVKFDGDRFEISYPYDDWSWTTYSGVLDRLSFASTAEGWRGSWTCLNGQQFDYTASSTLAGSLQSDKSLESAVERWIYQTPEGEVVITLQWKPSP